MAIKNFLYILISVLFVVSCSTKGRKPTVPEIVDKSEGGVPSATVKTLPRVGLILGPGGMRTFAHLGLIKELERASIPISAISGSEWGAFMAALYAVKGKSHDMEWKLQKLTSEFVPQKTLFQTKMVPQSFKRIRPYIKSTFGRSVVSDLSIPFSCPARSLTSEKSRFVTRGSLRGAVEMCLPFPPFFESDRGWVAEPQAIEKQIKWMASQGIDLVIYVDTLKAGGFANMASIKVDPAGTILWDMVRSELLIKESSGLKVVSVKMPNVDIADFDSRKKHVLSGQQAGLKLAEDLKENYGF